MGNQKVENGTVEFFKTLYENCDNNGFINLRLLPSKINEFIPIEKIDTIPFIIEAKKNQNIYFGVALRKDGDGTKQGIIQIPALWVDLDLEGLSEEEKEKIRQQYKEFPLKPSFVINSGGGLHIYWLLSTPLSSEEIQKVEIYLKRLATYFNADMASTDASRILRTPKTLNYKYDPPRKVEIKVFKPENEYPLSDFDFLPPLKDKIVSSKSTSLPGWEKELLEGVDDGKRTASMAKLAGRYVARGLSREEILSFLLNVDSKNNPPLSQDVVEKTLDSIIKTHQRNHPVENNVLNFIKKNEPAYPPPLAKKAFYGLAGDFIKVIEPHSEADPVALLIQFLSAFGNVVGSQPHFRVEADIHALKIYPVLVGSTSKGRKGTSWGRCKGVIEITDPSWSSRIVSGLSSGEGLIWNVRDEIEKQGEIVDQGIEDKRLILIEPEFASVLRILGRDGSILSAVIRQAWDDGNLRTLTKNNPAKATGAHISIIGHITRDELRRYLDRTEAGNGFANRFIWICVKRSKTLPEGGKLNEEELLPIIERLRKAVEFAKNTTVIKKDEEASSIWDNVYPDLSEGKPGLFGAVISRAEAQVMRIACIYALLDESDMIRKEHLLAALAVWDYSEASARYIFGDATGHPLADQILQALRNSQEGFTRTEIRDLLGKNKYKDQIDSALVFLQKYDLAKMVSEESGGRPTERWIVT